jgi:hypothetical protein
LKGAGLPPRLIEFLLQLLDALDGIGMPTFPVAYFPAKIGAQLL